jgi:hypothetical protein
MLFQDSSLEPEQPIATAYNRISGLMVLFKQHHLALELLHLEIPEQGLPEILLE